VRPGQRILRAVLNNGGWSGWGEIQEQGSTDAGIASAELQDTVYLFAKRILDKSINMATEPIAP